jgi:hypothetical protein
LRRQELGAWSRKPEQRYARRNLPLDAAAPSALFDVAHPQAPEESQNHPHRPLTIRRHFFRHMCAGTQTKRFRCGWRD